MIGLLMSITLSLLCVLVGTIVYMLGWIILDGWKDLDPKQKANTILFIGLWAIITHLIYTQFMFIY